MGLNILYRVCRRYVNHVNGENNSNIRTNGELRWLREVLPFCKTVFDVGANVGDWATLALEVSPNVNIHCFEPSLTTFDRLTSNLSNHSERVILNRFGLGERSEEKLLHCFGSYAGTNSLYFREGFNIRQTEQESVKLMSLDQYCDESKLDHVDLLKIDVEGHELSVLKGAKHMLEQGSIDRIQFEYGGTFIDARILLKDIFEILSPLGYRLFKIYPNRLDFADHYEQRFENFQYQNWVAKKPGMD